MAVFKCPSCGLDRKLPDKYADRRVRCPRCGESSLVAADAGDLHLDDVIEAEPAARPQAAGRTGGKAISEAELSRAMEAELRPRFIEGGALGNLAGGLVAGVLGVLFALAVATLVSSQGALLEHFPHAVTMALLGATVLGLAVALRSRIAFAAAGPETMTGVVLFLLAGFVQERMTGAPAEAVLATTLAALAVCGLFTGALLLAAGLSRSSDHVRYVPIQALGGVLAAVGFMLVVQAFGVALGRSVCLGDIMARYFDAELCLRWAPAIGLGVALFVVLRWVRNAYAVAALLALAVGACHGYLHWQGIGLEQARELGWLFGPLAARAPWAHVQDAGFLDSIDWMVIADCAGYVLALGGLVAGSAMIRISEMEVVTGKPVDLDGEFRVLGVGNMLCALGGGLPGTLSLDRSLGNRLAGASGMLAGLTGTAVCALALVLADRWLPLLPRFVPAGILAGLGLSLLWRWLGETRTRFTHKGDYALLVLVFLVTVCLGLLPGLAIGAALAMLVTAVRYGSVSVVRLEMSGANFHSHADRAPAQQAVLRAKGDQIHVLTLQGFIFLGTTNRLIEMITARLHDQGREPLRFVLLDFTFTSGLDSSVAISFIRMKQIAKTGGFLLVFTNVPFELETQLARAGCVLSDQDGGSITVTSLDYALEWAEDHILDEADELHQEHKNLAELLAPVFPDRQLIPLLLRVLTRVEVARGRVVFRQGDAPDSMYFIERGTVNVEMALEGEKHLRLKKMGPGTVFGEMGLYTSAPRSATVTAAEDCVLHRLPAKALPLLQHKRPDLAAAIHHFVVGLLADRVAASNAALREVLR
ncbi:cyclic nucleotide-binding domain-containing protein [Desulfocurvus vexinensis]|uniref:cyclic nucleotide-binding domain-containing protein n=1 Tax=Desulfocurvus vexinensis TaxID=399548 RepID=UPI0004AF0A56|nr:cyclic nucleotide-binding domain-containing protein [Desulfocurvus vexinensis]